MLDRLLGTPPARGGAEPGAARNRRLSLVLLAALCGACLARFEVGETGASDTGPTTGATTGAGGEGDSGEASTEGEGTDDAAEPCDACDPVLELCVGGECVCRSEFTPCGGICVDLDSDPEHCGSCGEGCEEGVCEDAECSMEGCQEGDATECGGSCVELESSVLHCGACDSPCLADELCIEGECVGVSGGSCVSDLDCEGGVCCEVEELDKICLDGDQCP